MEKCIYCGKPLKQGKRCECFGCRNIVRVFSKENPPRTKEKNAIKHLNKKGAGLLKQIFGF